MNLIKVDNRRRITLPKSARHDLYIISTTSPDGTFTLTPAVARSTLEDALRQQPGYFERLERDAVTPPIPVARCSSQTGKIRTTTIRLPLNPTDLDARPSRLSLPTNHRIAVFLYLDSAVCAETDFWG
jgi:hypothetical protein